ncbi:MAG: 4-(cytidine 5'-diphospho)-2-C-methyl-D-erythritol kinase [Candidatus Bipolaricaulota bacterium]
MKAHVLAYAKLNLCLEVQGLRSDGFHEIRSLVQTIDLADRIEIATGRGVRVSCSAKLDGPNIAEQAVRTLLKHKRIRAGVNIRIEKNIPMRAGLGGGSSDAAAVLAVVNRLLPPVIPSSDLLEIAGTIGADVPLFLTGGCVRVSGRGNPEAFLPPRSEAYAVLVPAVHCSTSEIYRAWHAAMPPKDRSQGDCRELGRNDLFPAAVRLAPVLQGFRNAVADLGGLFSGMTGSGSGFYAAFADRVQAEQACANLRRQEHGCRIYYCQPTSTGFAELTDVGFAEERDAA